jgi:hypothetical protein
MSKVKCYILLPFYCDHTHFFLLSTLLLVLFCSVTTYLPQRTLFHTITFASITCISAVALPAMFPCSCCFSRRYVRCSVSLAGTVVTYRVFMALCSILLCFQTTFQSGLPTCLFFSLRGYVEPTFLLCSISNSTSEVETCSSLKHTPNLLCVYVCMCMYIYMYIYVCIYIYNIFHNCP